MMIIKLQPKRRKEIRKRIRKIKKLKIIKYKVVFLIQVIWKVQTLKILIIMNKLRIIRIRKIHRKFKIKDTYLTVQIIKKVKIKTKKCAIMI